MIALTWVLDLPAATNMVAVREQAGSDGHALAQADGLLAGLFCVAEVGQQGATQNAVGLLSVWSNSSRMSAYLWGETMTRVERNLARPSGRFWAVSSVQVDRSRVLKATHAGLTVATAAVNQPLAARVDEHKGSASRALAGRSTALACRGFDAATWDEVSLDAWTGRPRAYAGRVFEVVAAAAPERN